MHRKWVVNASPLIVLGRVNHLFLLQHLAEEIVVPAGVAKEIARGPEDDPARQWLQAQGRELVREVQVVPPVIIASYHGRGADELVHRALKDFGFEELPFLRFAPNTALYYTMLVAFVLCECFKQDVCGEVIPLEAYATTLRAPAH
jgi:hypothetical protein